MLWRPLCVTRFASWRRSGAFELFAAVHRECGYCRELRYGADGSMTPMSQYDIACLMKALCDEYHRRTNTEPASPVRDVWGTWVSDDGQTELTIDSETYGGNKYSIIGIDGNSNMLKVSVQRNDGTIDDRWLQVIGDSMTVYEIFERDGVGDVVGYFTRIA